MPVEIQHPCDVSLETFAHYVELRAQEQLFSGVVLVLHDGEVLLERAYGFADREAQVPMTIDAKHRIGSINKLFTTVAILQLVEAGRLDLDAPIIHVLADYPNRELATRVTTRHLLTHTGGTGDIFVPEHMAETLAARDQGDFLAIFGERGVSFEPGTRCSYSNYGFILLGLMIERISEASYYDYVREHVYAPAGMAGTDSLPESTPVPGRVVAYTQRDPGKFDPNNWVPATDTLLYRGTAAGGGYSTARDVDSFVRALGDGRLISPAMFDKALARQANTHFGLGFPRSPDDGRRWYAGAGGAPGMNADFVVYRQSGYVAIMLSNLDPGSAHFLQIEFARLVIWR